MSQKSKQYIKEIQVKDLVFWKENPRDRIPEEFTEADIANRAIQSKGRGKWNLMKLFEDMKMAKKYYPSELPTVVYENNDPVVYDGNKRVLIGKLINGYIKIENCPDFSNFEFPQAIPCNVCDRQTALEYVFNKNSQSGSWRHLEKDIFAHKHLKKDQTPWMILDQSTHIISNNLKLNQRFVRDEVFKSSILLQMGFSVTGDVLVSHHESSEDARIILEVVVELIISGLVSTRQNRGQIIELLENDLRTLNILKRLNNKTEPNSLPLYILPEESLRFRKSKSREIKRKSPLQGFEPHELFGGALSLRIGEVNDLYLEIDNLYSISKEKRISADGEKSKFSSDYRRIIRMSLRLICDVAAQEELAELDKESIRKLLKKRSPVTWYIESHYPNARKNMSNQEKQILSSYNMDENLVLEQLHGGAHGLYISTLMEQTLSLSIIVGKILEESHGRH